MEDRELQAQPLIRTAVRSLYDAQKLRIEMGNRMSAQQRDGILSGEWAERIKTHQARMEAVEAELLRDVRDLCKTYDIWPWLKAVKGCGPAMSGVLISELGDPARFDTVSKLWAYSGLHVIEGRAARRKKGEKANWNPFLKTKLLGVLAGSFLKVAHTRRAGATYYRDFYDNYRNRLLGIQCSMTPAEHRKGATADTIEPNGCTKGHMHNKALRYMVKMFLADLLVEWRALRGLPNRPSYQEQYLGHQHDAKSSL